MLKKKPIQGNYVHTKPLTEVQFNLPWPPSVNAYWRIAMTSRTYPKWILTDRGKMYRISVTAQLRKQKINLKNPLQGNVVLSIIAFPPDKRIRDLDNLLKAVLDALQYANLYENDAQVKTIFITRGAVYSGGMLQVVLAE